MDYSIGHVIAVEGGQITIMLHNKYEDEQGKIYGVSDDMTVCIETEEGPVPLIVGQPGSFMEIQLPSTRILGTVIGIKMVEATSLINSGELSQNEVPVSETKRIVTVIPLGKFRHDGTFERGTDILPTVNAEVFAATPKIIEKVYTDFSEGDFSLGTLSIQPDLRAFVNLDVMLGRHTAILGQTGGGKSWTIASVLQKIASFPRSTVLLLDLHGEYKEAFGDYADYISANDIELPYWLMNFEELVSLCVDRAERSAPNQIAKFRDLLQKEKDMVAETENLDLPKVTLDTPIYFNFENIIKQLRFLDTQMVTGSSGKPKQGDYFGEFTRMIMRLESRLNDRRYDLIFNPKNYISSASMEALFKKILGEEETRKKIVVLDISPIPFDVRNSAISLILRLVFDFAYWFRRSTETEYPILVVCDEAHVYFNNYDTSSSAARISGERIAKEGRKYGVGLMVVSQRPREVSSTILSQCNTFMCLRITNPDDQSYVKNLLPDSIKAIVDMFASLRRGETIILGESVMMPTRVQIDIPEPTPNSNDVCFSEIWNQVDIEVPFEQIIDEWRRQGVKR